MRRVLIGPEVVIGSTGGARRCLAVAAVVILVSGCVAIPLPARESATAEREWLAVVDREWTDSRLSLVSFDAGGRLLVRLEGDRVETLAPRHETRYAGERRSLVLGFFPGLGARWYGGQTDGWVKEAFGISLLSLHANMLAGLPTWLPWISEIWSPWRPPSLRGTDRRAVYLSLFGYAKTGRTIDRVEVVDGAARTDAVVGPVRDEVVRLDLGPRRMEARTDDEGVAEFRLFNLRYLRPSQVRISTPFTPAAAMTVPLP